MISMDALTPDQCASMARRVRRLVKADPQGRLPEYWALEIGLDDGTQRAQVIAAYQEAEE